MKDTKKFRGLAWTLALCLCAMLTVSGCGASGAASVSDTISAVETESTAQSVQAEPEAIEASAEPITEAPADEEPVAEEPAAEAAADETAEAPAEPEAETAASGDTAVIVTTANVTSDGVIDGTELFSDRDLTQTPDLTDAVRYTVSDGTDIHIDTAGVYVLSGSAANVTVYVEAGTEDKVQLVLDGLTITNDDFPCVYVTGADKVFITSLGENSLTVSGTFVPDGDTNTDGVIFSREDLVFNGTGSLTVSSTDNGIAGKDDIKITGGTYTVTAASKAIEANDSIRIADGVLVLTAGTDGLHAENDEDDTLGYIYICGGELTIDAGDDGIHANSVVQIDGGTVTVTAAEGIEGTYIQINGGTIDVSASDDGINAAQKSSAYYPTIEINDGDVTVVMGAGDTDGIDSNGDIIINGGTIDVTGQSTFDYDGSGQLNGGTVIANGQQVSTLPNQMMGGGRGGRSWG